MHTYTFPIYQAVGKFQQGIDKGFIPAAFGIIAQDKMLPLFQSETESNNDALNRCQEWFEKIVPVPIADNLRITAPDNRQMKIMSVQLLKDFADASSLLGTDPALLKFSGMINAVYIIIKVGVYGSSALVDCGPSTVSAAISRAEAQPAKCKLRLALMHSPLGKMAMKEAKELIAEKDTDKSKNIVFDSSVETLAALQGFGEFRPEINGVLRAMHSVVTSWSPTRLGHMSSDVNVFFKNTAELLSKWSDLAFEAAHRDVDIDIAQLRDMGGLGKHTTGTDGSSTDHVKEEVEMEASDDAPGVTEATTRSAAQDVLQHVDGVADEEPQAAQGDPSGDLDHIFVAMDQVVKLGRITHEKLQTVGSSLGVPFLGHTACQTSLLDAYKTFKSMKVAVCTLPGIMPDDKVMLKEWVTYTPNDEDSIRASSTSASQVTTPAEQVPVLQLLLDIMKHGDTLASTFSQCSFAWTIATLRNKPLVNIPVRDLYKDALAVPVVAECFSRCLTVIEAAFAYLAKHMPQVDACACDAQTLATMIKNDQFSDVFTQLLCGGLDVTTPQLYTGLETIEKNFIEHGEFGFNRAGDILADLLTIAKPEVCLFVYSASKQINVCKFIVICGTW